MASAAVLQSNIGNITGAAPPDRGSAGECRPGIFGDASILKFGRSLPLIELFETFIMLGLVMIAVFTSGYYTFHNVSKLLKSEGGTQASIKIADEAATTQAPWIAVGATFFIIGIVLYFLHRRIATSPA